MKNRVAINTIASFVEEMVIVVCGFILPRLIISNFGSDYNGIVASVNQFLAFVTLLRGGVGGVTRAALYKPLLNHDYEKISGILKATEIFMRRIAYIFLGMLLVFACVYPIIVKQSFGWLYTFTLILILGITTFSQYYFGIAYQFLLHADQRLYVVSALQTIATILNTFLCVVLIYCNVEFRLVKLVSALIFAMIPICMYWFVHHKYTVIKTIPADNSAISQRWDAFYSQLSAFINSNTDVVVLTLFSDLFQVSVYSVYNMVVMGISQFVTTGSGGIEAAIGAVSAKNNKAEINRAISLYELIINTISAIAFSCTIVLLVPFVKIYTVGVTDVDYIQPLFGFMLVIAFFIKCVRLPYQNVVEVKGLFKETKLGAIIEAVVNITVSIVLVMRLGCIGVAIGTIVATLYRTIDLAIYASINILNRKIIVFVKRMIIDVIVLLIIVIPYLFFQIDIFFLSNMNSYFEWFVGALVVLLISTVVVLISNFLFYKKDTIELLHLLFKKVSRV